MERTIKIKKIYDDVELPTKNSIGFDLRIHSFHKILDLTGEIEPHNSNTFLMQGGSRVLVKMGFSVDIPEGLLLQIVSRTPACIKDGLIVMDAPKIINPTYNKEIEVLLYAASGDRVILLQKGFRIATAQIIMRTHFDLAHCP
jgi:dUTPase